MVPNFSPEQALNRKRAIVLETEERALRREKKHREWNALRMHLSYDDAATGVPCRACGQPVIDHLGDWPVTLERTTEEQIAYESAAAALQAAHPDCHEGRWAASGSRTLHCTLCCPPPPFSPAALNDLRQVLQGISAAAPEALDTWALRLSCDHRVEHASPYTQQNWTALTIRCPKCRVIRGVLTSTRIREAIGRGETDEDRRQRAADRAREAVVNAEALAELARQKLAALERGDGADWGREDRLSRRRDGHRVRSRGAELGLRS